ncbi:MAG: hypothetical protein E7617_06170 [Ruminococcaceae bacterium]|nr:hypothetical protein [Oscillospiraceae bacterium]
MNVKARLNELNVPDVLCPFGKKITTAKEFEEIKPKIQKLLCREEYGFIPPAPEKIWVENIEKGKAFAAGKSTLTKHMMHAVVNGRELSFAFTSNIPTKASGRMPAFIHINFRDLIPDQYQPTEEIIDRGYAVYTVCYQDVSTDNGDFNNNCAPILCPDRTDPHAPGKIAMWAWAAMRVIDYALENEKIDPEAIAVIGHSRLGKTALLTAAFDERVSFVCVNNSGASGDALSRGKVGESIKDITNRFPFWFCPKYLEYADRENDLPFDQHFLLSLVAPRTIILGTADEDQWADPHSEYLALTLTNPVYALYGKRGFVFPDEIPQAPFVLHEGDACAFHTRLGLHYLSRTDWNIYMDYIDSKLGR